MTSSGTPIFDAVQGRALSTPLNAIAARWAALTVSAWGAIVGMYHIEPNISLLAIDILVVLMVGLGYADIVWHDINGRKIWPSLPDHIRHRVCVGMYSVLGASWLLRAFGEANALRDAALATGFAVCMASICGLVAVALAVESRQPIK